MALPANALPAPPKTTATPSAAPSASLTGAAPTPAKGQDLTVLTSSTNPGGSGSPASIVNGSVFSNPYLASNTAANTNTANAIAGQSAYQAQTAGQAPVAQAQNVGPSQVFLQGQQQTAAGLQQEANGQGAAAQAVQMQTQNATNQGIAAQAALAGSARGGNAGEMARQAAMGQAAVTGQAANQAQSNTLAAEQQGLNNLGSVQAAGQNESNAIAQQATSTNLANAGALNTSALQNQQLGTQTALANAAASNSQQQFGDSALVNAVNNNNTMDTNQYSNLIQGAEYNAGTINDVSQADQGHQIAQQNANTSAAGTYAGIAGQTLQAAGNIGSAISDKRAKKKVEDGDKNVSAFLDHLAAKTWTYKDQEKHGIGRQTGVMAQDLEKSLIGKQMVKEGPDGVKMVDYGKGFAGVMAAIAHLNQQIKQMKAKNA